MIFSYHEKLGRIVDKKNKWFKDISFNAVEGLEIVLSDPQVFRSCTKEQLQLLSLEFKGNHLTTHLPFYDLNYGSVDNNISIYSLEIVLEALKISNALGASGAVAHINLNRFLPEKAFEKWFKSFKEAKNKIEEKGKDLGISVFWENTYEENFKVFDRMLDDNPDTAFCLDAGHCNCFADFSSVEFIERYGKSVKHLHLHDNDGKEDSHLVPGSGNVPFEEMMKKIDLTDIRIAVFEVDRQELSNNRKTIEHLFFGQEAGE